MRRTSKYSEEQIVTALRQAEAGTPVVDLCRKMEITETTFYRWKKKCYGLGVSELRELAERSSNSAREFACIRTPVFFI